MRIVAVLGSPRPRGNSSTLARRFLKAAREAGADTRSFHLSRLQFQGCVACAACKTKAQACILKDDLGKVLRAIKRGDILVLASPVYFGEISGQLKCFFDRTYSFLNPDFSSRVPLGKKAVLILSQADPDPSHYDDIFARYERWLHMFGFDPVYLLRAVGVREAGAVKQQTALPDEAAALARRLLRQPASSPPNEG